MMTDRAKRTVKAVILIIVALVSIFVLSRFATSTEFHAKSIAALDEKRTTVMELTAASTAASAAITLIPGDAVTPIAEKLADLSSNFLLVICAIWLEKYLLTITGYATFVVLIPLACVLGAINAFLQNDKWRELIRKLVVLGLAIVLVVPVSVKVSDMIEATYQSSIETTIDSAREAADGAEDEEGGLSGLLSKIKDGVSGAVTGLENVLNRFIEALAVMIITSCVIPIFVLLFFIWIIKMVTSVDIKLPKVKLPKPKAKV
ncbi:MAG: hypothetical protein DBY10_01525 [Clostridiales bacterium]|nr:MAG: hypothetical protein DBY10_01525 [Clostridiales bacterium]